MRNIDPLIPPKAPQDLRDAAAEQDDLADFLRSLRSSRARLRRISPSEVLVSLDDEPLDPRRLD